MASGTLISQIVVILSSPILSRIYSVNDFGYLSLFTSVVSIAAVLSTGRYELAIGIPEIDKDSLSIFNLILIIGCIISTFYFTIIFLFKEILMIEILDGFFLKDWIYILPIYIFIIAILSAMLYWLQRKKLYKKITIVNAFQVILTTLFSLLLGFFKVQSGMIISLVLSAFIVVLYIFFTEMELNKAIGDFENVKFQAKKFANFPKFALLSDLSLSISQQFIPILFSIFYSTTVVGFYSMANRILRLPNIIITNAIGSIFRNEAIDDIRNKGNCSDIYRSTFKKLVIISFPIYLLLFMLSPYLFDQFLGNQWRQAGVFGRIISVFLFLEFIAVPLSSVYYIRNYQKRLMKLQMLNTFFGGIAIFLGAFLFRDSKISLILFSMNSLFFNLLVIRGSFRISKINSNDD
jgi:teichuronic acid exporter